MDVEAMVMDLEELKEVMEESGINTLDEFKNVFILTTSNYGGMVIMDNSTEESVFVQEVWGKGKHKDIVEKEIRYRPDGRAYFEYEGEKYNLDEFLRKNYPGGV
jgi:hypothetical protein